jgi:GAF domain-containing protein
LKQPPSPSTGQKGDTVSANLRARETALRGILNAIANSTDDELPVFDAILENASRLCDAPLVFVSRVNEAGTHLHIPAHRGARPEMQKVFNNVFHSVDDSEIVSAHAVRNRSVYHVEDMATDPQFDRSDHRRAELIDVEGVRSYLVVPMLRGDTCFGTINLYRRHIARFSDDEIALVETFAEQAVIAIENVRQFRELQMRVEREAASREILGVISQSRNDETPVFDVILKNAAHLSGAPLANLVLLNAARSHWHLVAHFGDGLRQLTVGKTVTPLESELVPAVAMRTARVVQIEDLTDTDLYRQGDPGRVAMVEVEGMRTILGIPLLGDTGAIGSITLFRREVKAFTSDEIALVETFAAQAVIAIENVRQFREVQMRLEREQASREILQVISQSRADEAPVFQVILEKAARLCGAPMAGLALVNESRSHMTMTAHWGEPLQHLVVGETQWAMDVDYVLTRAARESRAIQVEDLAQDPLTREGNRHRSDAVEGEGVRTFLAVPLISQGQTIGCFGLYRREVSLFSNAEIELVETFAEQAVIAIENTRQFKALQDRTAEVEDLNVGLETRVDEQVDQLERLGRLRRFLSPQVADAVVSEGADALLGSHRAMIAILFCDIRGFTAFCESAEPEETIEVLQTFHETLGKLIHDAGAGFDHRSGDGIMVIFNDPIPCDDPAAAALRVAFDMRDAMDRLCAGWRKLGHRLGFGVGISLGYATVGMVGFEGRYDYTASGTAVNLASRLCDHAADREILLSPRAAIATEDIAIQEPAGDLTLKGFQAPVVVVRAAELKGVA